MALVRLQRRAPRSLFPGFAASTAFPSLPSFEDVENRMSRFIERALNEPFSATFAEPIGWAPAIDLVETPKEFTLTAELPGMDLKDVDVSVEDGVMTLRGEKMEERKEEDDRKVYLYERSYGAFQRSFALPAGVDASKVSAEFQKGVLKVHIPKDGEAVPKGRKIEIKSV
jgi:HSP20 family protein